MLGPEPEQLEQLVSHDWHADDVLSKNWFLLQVGRQRQRVEVDGDAKAGDAHGLLRAEALDGLEERPCGDRAELDLAIVHAHRLRQIN